MFVVNSSLIIITYSVSHRPLLTRLTVHLVSRVQRVKADVAIERRATGFTSSDIPINEPRSEAKVIPMNSLHRDRPREKLSRGEASSPRH